ncbi:hypothetical protein ACP70R_013867 [Stipagrostis hirtigluma subsp. patula]
MEEDSTSSAHSLSPEDDSMKMGFVDDYLCAFCDEGGNLICCDGECGRLFHPSKSEGAYSKCVTLDLSAGQQDLPKFLCKNCEHKQHQCFVCWELGSSDMSSGSAEVLQCNNKNCRRFYHLKCLPGYDPSKDLQDFECPMHECYSCNNIGEGTKKQTTKVKKIRTKSNEREMCLVLCRRCPIAYHQKCLPREISIVAKGEVPRTWETEGGRPFFYCKKHKMVKALRSPSRDHIKFPEVEDEHRVDNNVGNQEQPSIKELSFDLNMPPPEDTETP